MSSPISIDSNDIQCTCCININSNTLPNLFANKSREGGCLQPDINRNGGSDVHYEHPLYGVTVNIHPYKSMNRKRWFTYSHDKQRAQLARIEASLRNKNPSIKLIELHYEVAPGLNDPEYRNIHFHALYEMPPLFVSTMENYYTRIVSAKASNWKHLDVKTINNKQAWLDYIRKDII